MGPVGGVDEFTTVTTVVTAQPATWYLICVVPNATPHTVPAVGPAATTVATPGVLLVQIPPVVGELVNTEHAPRHTLPGPAIVDGYAFTLTVRVTKQPLPRSYVIVVVPTVRPVTTPVVASTDPMAGALLLQVPPAGVELRVVVAPRHAMLIPVMAVGVGVTVTTATELQPATV